MMLFCIQVAEYQIQQKKFFYLEQPVEASSWQLNAIEWLRDQIDVFLIFFDQCEAGLSLAEDTLLKKPTGVLSNHAGIITRLAQFQCQGNHHHLQLQSGLRRRLKFIQTR